MELLIKLSVLAVGISYLNIREIVTLNLYAEINVNLSFFKVQIIPIINGVMWRFPEALPPMQCGHCDLGDAAGAGIPGPLSWSCSFQ